MIPVFIGIGTFLLILVAITLILVVLAQRAKSDGGLAGMGGGMMESAFGPDTSNVLSKFTIRATIVFFVLSFLLYLGYVHNRSHASSGKGSLPNITSASSLPVVPAGTAPAAGQPAATPGPVAAPGPAASVPAAPDAAKPGAAGKAP
jgi:preprotein translocase subunit SecG